MGLSMLGSMSMAGSRASECISGMMGLVMLANGLIIKFKELESICGLMAGIMRAIGLIIICKALGFINGMMGGFLLDNINKIKNMGMENTFGLIRGLTLAIGIRENNMDLGSIRYRIIKSMGFGKTENEFNGLKNKQKLMKSILANFLKKKVVLNKLLKISNLINPKISKNQCKKQKISYK